jgi:hypothetical protein
MAVQLKTLTKLTLAANVKQALSPTPMMVYSATLQGISTNTGTQYLGDTNVTANNGILFSGSDVVEIDGPPSLKGQEQFDLSKMYVISDAAGCEIRVAAWIRE